MDILSLKELKLGHWLTFTQGKKTLPNTVLKDFSKEAKKDAKKNSVKLDAIKELEIGESIVVNKGFR